MNWWHLLSGIALLGLVACAPTPGPTPSPTPSPPLWEGVTPIGEIRAHPDKYTGQEVTVLAYFRGWDLFGEAGFGPPVTRSDVAVADPTGGIYIVPGKGFEGFQGAPPLPPHRPQATHTLLWIQGVVRIDARGYPYIEVTKGKTVTGLPLSVVLWVHRTGTFVGVHEDLWLAEDGSAYFLDYNTSEHRRFSVDPQEVARVLSAARGYAAAGEIGTPHPDMAIHEFTFWEGNAVHTLRVVGQVEEPPLTDAVATVGRWFAAAREQPQ